MSQLFHTLTVSKIVSETPQSKSVFFDVPEGLKEAYAFKAGQYLTLKFQIEGQEVRRAYSICVSPHDDLLGVNVKRVPKGLVSNHINDHLMDGNEVEVMIPEGKFVIDTRVEGHRDFYFFVAGSGITPAISLIKTLLEEEPKSHCYLLYGNRHEDSIIFKSQLESLSRRYQGQFILRHTLSKPNRDKKGGLKGFFSKGIVSWTGWQGRIDNAMIDRFLNENPPVGRASHYFVCGPGAMIDTIIDHLESKNIDSDYLHTEHFSVASAPTAGLSNAVDSNVKIYLSGKEYQVKVPADKTILDVLIDEKIDAPYSCTSGACSTCIGKVLKGSVVMDACYALDDSEIKEGYVLVCQSRATTDVVEITFDT